MSPPPQPRASADELKPITALFADVVGSTRLGESLTPAEVKALIGECVSRMARVIETYGGVVQAYMGDGICAYFGVPTAHEDDPERAARAALGIVETVRDYARDIEAAWQVSDFDVRVGINTGQTAVGLVGASDPQAVALGDTTNVAARLQSAAAPGTIVVGEPTAKHLRERFELAELGEVDLKGKSQPVRALRLDAIRAEPEVDLAPIFGRARELAALESLAADIARGRGHILVLSGDTGIGKTRLVQELRRLCSPETQWLQGRCLSYGSTIPYWPLVEALRGWLGVAAGESEIALRTRLRARLMTVLGDDAQKLMPTFATLLGIHQDEATPAATDVAAGLREWIAALARIGPVALSIDDAHWADPATAAAIGGFFRATDREPLTVVLTLRTDIMEEGRALRALALSELAHRTSELRIAPLDDDAAAALADHLAPEPGLAPEARTKVVQLAEGNPLYLGHLVRALIEGGELIRQQTWTLSVRPEDLLPPTLEGLLLARIDRLPEEARHVAQCAAIIGRDFSVPLLRRVCGDAEVEGNLVELFRTGVAREERRFPELVCSFTHGLVQEAALSNLTPARRREVYGRVATAFEDLHHDSIDEHLETLSFYWYRSDEPSRARPYLERAAAKARAAGASQRADELLRRAAKSGATSDRLPVLESGDVSTTADAETVGRFHLEELLGEGATGKVWRAAAPGGTTVALKVLRPELTQDEVFRRRFVHEARAAREVEHPHLVNVLDAGEVNGLLFTVMEFLEGDSLSARLRNDAPMAVEELVRIVGNIGSGLDELHKHGIVHRDVKPSNIILTARGATLTDFGLAKGRAYTVLTKPGQMIGTLDYMAPEIIKGEEATAASDVYALACVAFECLCGAAPFADRGVFQVGMAHLVDEPPNPVDIRSDVPEGIGWSVLQGLAKDPARRPPTATAFANLLRLAAGR